MKTSRDIIVHIIEEHLDAMRPPAELRKDIDLGYTFTKQKLELFEIRPRYDDKSIIMHHPFAKAKFIRSQNIWKIYWRRASGKWDLYAFPRGDEYFRIFYRCKRR